MSRIARQPREVVVAPAPSAWLPTGFCSAQSVDHLEPRPADRPQCRYSGVVSVRVEAVSARRVENVELPKMKVMHGFRQAGHLAARPMPPRRCYQVAVIMSSIHRGGAREYQVSDAALRRRSGPARRPVNGRRLAIVEVQCSWSSAPVVVHAGCWVPSVVREMVSAEDDGRPRTASTGGQTVPVMITILFHHEPLSTGIGQDSSRAPSHQATGFPACQITTSVGRSLSEGGAAALLR